MMKTIKVVAKSDAAGRLKLEVPTTFSNQTVEVRIAMTLLSPNKKEPFDFSDLSGKLKWTGDAVKAQRNIRDEW